MNGDTLKSKSSNWFKIKKTPEKCSENDLQSDRFNGLLY